MSATILTAGDNRRMKPGETPSRSTPAAAFLRAFRRLFRSLDRNRTANLSYFMGSMPESALLRKSLTANNAGDFVEHCQKFRAFEI
ncbi:hypothetical protein [Sinorhizobium saheli]|uniref:hypothetical protein n=1 Tax=Sinorhizobium saheli TaxID=36856 RepID=UPI000ACED1B8|nr:hypothetical protein [Sinorhizobium saheli]MQW88047.1 hypothetical protein [Sinorhizobium saheli]